MSTIHRAIKVPERNKQSKRFDQANKGVPINLEWFQNCTPTDEKNISYECQNREINQLALSSSK